MRVLLALVWFLALGQLSEATNQFITSFDTANQEPTNIDSYEFVEHLVNSATDSMVGVQTSVTHDALNGGAVGSHHALVSDLVGNSGRSAFISLMGHCSLNPGVSCASDTDCPHRCTGNTAKGCMIVNGVDGDCGAAAPCALQDSCVGWLGREDCFTGGPNCNGLREGSNVFSLNVDTPPANVGEERTVFNTYEALGADVGCFITLNSQRQLSLYYGDPTQKWGVASPQLFKNACESDPTFKCSNSANAALECPGDHHCSVTQSQTCNVSLSGLDCPPGESCVAEGCTRRYWAQVKMTQVNKAPGVICELTIDGNPIFVGQAKIVSQNVGFQRDFAAGVSNNGTTNAACNSGPCGAPRVYIDDVVVDDSSEAAAQGFVDTIYPSANGPTGNWNTNKCKPKRCTDGRLCTVGTDCPTPATDGVCHDSTIDYECVDDWGTSNNGAAPLYQMYTLDNSDDTVATSSSKPRAEQFTSSQPTLMLPAGGQITSAEVVSVGRTNARASNRPFRTGFLDCPTNACIGNVCTNPGVAAGTACIDFRDCCLPARRSSIQPITNLGYFTAFKLLDRFLITQAPVPGDIDLSNHFNELGLAFDSLGLDDTLRVGAMLAYVRITKPDSRFEGITFQDHNTPGYPCIDSRDCGCQRCSVTTSRNCNQFIGCPTGELCQPSTACNTCSNHACTNNQDNIYCSVLIGDSTLEGSAETNCLDANGNNTGVKCTNASYCAYDANGEHDKPSGGCGDTQVQATANAHICQVCQQRRNLNANSGYACGPLNPSSPGHCSTTTLQTCAVNADCPQGPPAETCNGAVSGSCFLGSCDSTGHCTGDANIACTVGGAEPGNCDLGVCDTCATSNCGGLGEAPSGSCIMSCPGGVCPVGRSGWGGSFQTLINADEVLIAGQGSETLGEMWRDRFHSIINGIGYPGGPGGGFVAAVGHGKCSCITDADCGGVAGACAVDGLCHNGSLKQHLCQKQSDCAVNRICQFHHPDDAHVVEAYNDHIIGGGSITADKNCSSAATINGSSVTESWACPQVGTSAINIVQFFLTAKMPAGYFCPRAECSYTGDAATAAISPNAECAGRITSAGLCSTSAGVCPPTCPNSGACVDTRCAKTEDGVKTASLFPCTLDSSGGCGSDGDCVLGQTCDGANPLLPQLKTGWCRCATNANCPATSKCVGLAGKKMCRRLCSNDATCGNSLNGLHCDLTTCVGAPNSLCQTTGGFCKGYSTCPCNAVSCGSLCSNDVTRSCAKDGDCLSGGVCTAGYADDNKCGGINYDRTGGFRRGFLRGICNPATHKCANCGNAACGMQEELRAGCSCVSTNDCCTTPPCANVSCTGGICTANRANLATCTTNSGCATDEVCFAQRCTPIRQSCDTDYQCKLGGKCMSAFDAYAHNSDGFRGLAIDRYKQMMIAAGPGGPNIIASGLPAPAGLNENQGLLSFTPDRDCFTAYHMDDRSYVHSLVPEMLAAGFNPRHIVDFAAEPFDLDRMFTPLHSDEVHFDPPGSTDVGVSEANVSNRLNVCLKATGYCSRVRSHSCTADADCNGPQFCIREPQRYCKRPNKIFDGQCSNNALQSCLINSDCGAGNSCNPRMCETSNDCPVGACARRRCDGLLSNCPTSVALTGTVVCGPD